MDTQKGTRDDSKLHIRPIMAIQIPKPYFQNVLPVDFPLLVL